MTIKNLDTFPSKFAAGTHRVSNREEMVKEYRCSMRHNAFHDHYQWGRVTLMCVGNLTTIGSDNALWLVGVKPLSEPMLEYFIRNLNIFHENAFENVVADDMFKCNAFNENVWILAKFNWRRTGDKSLSEAMLICFTDAYMRHSTSMSWADNSTGMTHTHTRTHTHTHTHTDYKSISWIRQFRFAKHFSVLYRSSMGCHTMPPVPLWVLIPGPCARARGKPSTRAVRSRHPREYLGDWHSLDKICIFCVIAQVLKMVMKSPRLMCWHF